MSEKVIIIGSGGHGKVIADLVFAVGDHLLGFLDDDPNKTSYAGVPILGPISLAPEYPEASFVIAIGDNYARERIAREFHLNWYTAIHPTAVISPSAKIGVGSMVLANAVINADSVVGSHSIINTAAVVEHENSIGDFVHISTRAALGGCVQVNKLSQIGIGASVKNGVRICSSCLVGAGATVVNDLTESGVYIGTPAKRMLLR